MSNVDRLLPLEEVRAFAPEPRVGTLLSDERLKMLRAFTPRERVDYLGQRAVENFGQLAGEAQRNGEV